MRNAIVQRFGVTIAVLLFAGFGCLDQIDGGIGQLPAPEKPAIPSVIDDLGGGAKKPPSGGPRVALDIDGVANFTTFINEDGTVACDDVMEAMDDAAEKDRDSAEKALAEGAEKSAFMSDMTFSLFGDQDIVGDMMQSWISRNKVLWADKADAEITIQKCKKWLNEECKEPWQDVRDAYGALYDAIASGKPAAEVSKLQDDYDESKENYEYCQQGLVDIQVCRDEHEKALAKINAELAEYQKVFGDEAAQRRLGFLEAADRCIAREAARDARKAAEKAAAAPAAATTGKISGDAAFVLGNTTYFVVKSTDPTGNTGDKVCAKYGKTCVGYTAKTVDICTHYHPGAQVKEGVDGSNAGFFCDGPPQGGICAKETNTCRICPRCNVNADCDDNVGDLYRELYVECK